MKRLIILIITIIPANTFASAPSTSCPSGYVAIKEDYITIANTSCPSGHTPAGTATSCLISSPSGSCIMYAPANTPYTDNTGTYIFTSPCPMQ